MRIASLFATSLLGCVSSVPLASPDFAPGITITTEQTCPSSAASCDILEIVDLHTDAASEDKGFDELRQRAAQRGGNAVLGAEFEHGDGDERSHLSGVIVRYGSAIPPHVVLGEIDVPSDPDDQAKGLSELTARGHRLGGDQVIGVTFEHGEAGEVDIPSDPDDQDKGLAALEERGRAMGGDRVIKVSFEHGEDGAQGHLRGTVIRYTR